MIPHQFDVVIIGSGIVGLSSAIYCGRFKLKTLVIGEMSGGTLVFTDNIENYPGFESISGMDLTAKVRKHAEKFGAQILDDKVVAIERCPTRADGLMHDSCGSCYKVHTKDRHFHTKAIIIATGTTWRKLDVPGESEFQGKGVHNCALCDGYAFAGKTVAVIGGSDSAAKEALLLTEYAEKVYIIYRGEKIRPEPITLEKVRKNSKIEIINNTNVIRIKGQKSVNSIVLDKPYNGSSELALDGIFVEIGHLPLTELAASTGVKLNSKKEIIADQRGMTSVPGIFAAGDVVESIFKQAITGVAEGVIAAYSAYKYVTETEIICILDDEDL